MRKKVVITGASGFIGYNLLEAVLKRGYQVTAFLLPGDALAETLKAKNVHVVFGDIRNLEDVKNAISEGTDIVFHCAAYVSDWGKLELFEAITVNGTENVCKASVAANVKRLVKISTNDVFGIDESVVIDESHPLCIWNEPYPDTKLKAEEIAWSYHKNHGLQVTMVYPCWVYGPGDKTFVPLLADAILKREMVFFRKNALVWPSYVDNVVDLMLHISEHENAVGNGYLVHDGESDTLENFTNKIATHISAKEVTTCIPYFLAYWAAVVMEFFGKLFDKKERPLLTTYTVKNLGSRLRFSIEKANKELNWKPKTSYTEGFAKTMDWLDKQNKNELKQK